ncbi:hypothetical protein B488_10470 [Liberibacter crescens BT-1]|uniref:GumN family protein n=1 Tax=Liberibacter crescens (strain BT-1) TaxID=1215343 RepID=L0EU37_LIBCB|nr:TraB/GumN family protein [Liberibacter crescens]AGA65039.1 hypothetical protein B488_10470 [Liberibacter crescens BT-1]
MRFTIAILSTVFLVNKSVAEERKEYQNNNKSSSITFQKERNSALRKIANAIPNSKGIFWMITKENVAPSYLLGTLHLTDPRLHLSPKIQSIYNKMQTIVVESADISDTKAILALIKSNPDLVIFTDKKTINDFLSSEMLKILEKNLNQRGLNLKSTNHLKPWILKSIVTTPAHDFIAQSHGIDFFDKKLALEALSARKKLQGLETLKEQLSLVASIPLQTHIDLLIDALKTSDNTDTLTEEIINLYLQGDIGMIIAKIEASIPKDSPTEKNYKIFEEKILVERNQLMLEKSLPILNNGNAFIAIGALHLPKSQGFIELLRQKGFSVTRIQ